MIEENILDWIELGDSIQRMELYKKSIPNFKLFCALSQYSHFSIYFYYFIIILFFGQIWSLNIYALNDVKGDLLLEVLHYFDKIFLIEDLVTKKNKLFYALLIVTIAIFILSNLLLVINTFLINKKKYKRFLLALNTILNLLNIYYLNGPYLEIITFNIRCYNGDKDEFEICSFKETGNLIILIICAIYCIFVLINLFFISLYINDIGCINGTNVKCKISSNFTIILALVKLIYFLFRFLIFNFIGENNRTINLFYYLSFIVFNCILSIYANQSLYYYNNSLNNWTHNGFYFSTWFSICIFIKFVLKLKVISLAIFFGIIIIFIGLYFYNYYSIFNLVTRFNIFEANKLKDIEKYNNMLLTLLKSNDNNEKILLLGIIERFEEYLSANPELNEQYQKLINDKHLQKKFSSTNELIVLSIISIVYSYNIEKSKDISDLTFCMCYFLVNTFKNPTYAIWLCTKIKERTHIQSYYKYVLMEEIKKYLLNNLTKNKNKLSIKHVQLSSVILYNQYIDLFKMKIYDATCSQIEYFELLKNSTTTVKTTKNFLKIGEDILNLRKDILGLWDKIIFLNPFNNESQKDYMIYIEIILQDDALMRSEEKKYNTLKTEKLSERNNLYYSLFLRDFSSVLISEGYSYNGKIIYTSPNFSSMFLFSGKEILNYSIDDLLPDVVQVFHKYLIEDAIKFSNLNYIFRNQRNVLLKGKNGILFNVNLYVKPSPNLSFGLVYFSNLQKITEQNLILILDENLIINGFSGIFQSNSSFSLNNNYNLTYGINGHHIGLVIPEILLQLNYDQKRNIFLLNQNGIDLKGSLYPLNEFQELDKKIKKILEIVKSRKNAEMNSDNKSIFSQEYNYFVKYLNSVCPESHSIFFKIESHSFLLDKYHYYRIYIMSDLFSANDTTSVVNTEQNMSSMEIDKSEKNNEETITSKFSKVKPKTLNDSSILETKILKQSTDLNNTSENKGEKIIRLKTQKYKEQDQINEKILKKKAQGVKGIHLIQSENTKKNKDKNVDSSENNKNNNVNNLEMILDLSRASSPSSILTQSSTDSVELNKIKNEISSKNDSFYIKIMKYSTYLYAILVLTFVIIEFAKTTSIFNSMIDFLEENRYFSKVRIDVACLYNSFLGAKYLKNYYMPKNFETIIYNETYAKLIIKCINDIENLNKNMYYYHDDFLNIFNQKTNVSVHPLLTLDYDYLYLDLRNWLNLLISHCMKIYTYFNDYLGDNGEYENLLSSYIMNILENSYKFFYSNYIGFNGEEKEKKCEAISANSPIDLIIICILAFSLSGAMGYYVYQINGLEIFYLERLINFTSPNFEEYLKRLDELKKKFREDNNEEDDKNPDDAENKDDEIDANDELYSGRKGNKKNLDKSKNNDNKNSKKKKSKQNKLYQKRQEKKKIMSKHFYKINFFFLLRISIILVISIVYFIVSLIITAKLKSNYYKFDNIIEEIDKVFFNSYDIFLTIKKSIEIFSNANFALDKINIPKESDITKPKFGNVLMNLINNDRYTNSTLVRFSTLYNGNSCVIFTEDESTDTTCSKIFSSILSKGIEQSIVQMGIVISGVLEELTWVKNKESLLNIFNTSESYKNYEAFMGKYLLKAFWETNDIMKVFRNDEKNYIFKINNILLVAFMCVYMILLVIFIYFIYDYVTIFNSFLNFIGILPSKFICDDDMLYQNILKLQEFY